jgi:trehalose 6-phosphate synthase/phosphatase
MDDIQIAELIEKFKKAENRLILLDYDGTLVNYEMIPQKAILSEDLGDILMTLIDKPQTKILIISGRGHSDIDILVDHLPIDIIAEHGAMMKTGGIWRDQATKDATWKKEVINIFEQITASCPGSYIEEKKFSLTWHYRNSDPQAGFIYSRELILKLENVIPTSNLKILDGNKVVEIMSVEIGKGKAVEKLLETKEYDFIISIGDDTTDEEIFELLLPDDYAFTIKVGNGNTFAKERFDSVSAVVLFLKQLSE